MNLRKGIRLLIVCILLVFIAVSCSTIKTSPGKTEESILFITIDGRAETADGMTLIELQKYLHDLGCIDAINLDGGGSTTMWTKNKGVVNKPSDKDGERPVANAVLILENE